MRKKEDDCWSSSSHSIVVTVSGYSISIYSFHSRSFFHTRFLFIDIFFIFSFSHTPRLYIPSFFPLFLSFFFFFHIHCHWFLIITVQQQPQITTRTYENNTLLQQQQQQKKYPVEKEKVVVVTRKYLSLVVPQRACTSQWDVSCDKKNMPHAWVSVPVPPCM